MSGRPRVFIHIGTPKTGTTYLQHVLWRNRRLLRSNGLLYPGDRPQAHFWASLDLRQVGFGGYRSESVPGAWPRLVEEIRRWGGSSVIDHETLAGISSRRAAVALADLDFADVHVICTARDLARQLPAAWQERMKNRDVTGFGDFLAGVMSDDPAERKRSSFWWLHDVPTVVGRWARHLPPERIHVVTVPPAGAPATVLWQRFASVLGLDATAYDLDVPASNSSLGAVEAAVLRRLNVEVRELDIPWLIYARTVKHVVGPALGEQRGTPIALPDPALQWVARRSGRLITILGAAGYDIVGDLQDLLPAAGSAPAPPGIDPDSVDARAQLDRAVHTMALLLHAVADPESRRAVRGPDRSPARPAQEAKRWFVQRAVPGSLAGTTYRSYLRARSAVRREPYSDPAAVIDDDVFET